MANGDWADAYAAEVIRYLKAANPDPKTLKAIVAGAARAGFKRGMVAASMDMREQYEHARGPGKWPRSPSRCVAFYEAAEHLRLKADGGGHEHAGGLLRQDRLDRDRSEDPKRR